MEKALLIVSLATNVAMFFIVIAMAKAMINMAKHRTNRVKWAIASVMNFSRSHSRYFERWKFEYKIRKEEFPQFYDRVQENYRKGRGDMVNVPFAGLPEELQEYFTKKFARDLAAKLYEHKESIWIGISLRSYELNIYGEISFGFMSSDHHAYKSAMFLRTQFPNI